MKYWSPPEQKFLDTTALGINTSAPRIILLNGIAEGTGVSQRVGRKIKMTSVQGRMSVYVSTATTSPSVRCMIVYDMQTNSTLAGLGDILQVFTAGSDFISPYNLNNRDRFRVLWDKTYTVNAVNNERATFKFYKKLKLDTVYDNTGAIIDDISTGSLLLLFFSSDRTVAANPVVDYYARVRYMDN